MGFQLIHPREMETILGERNGLLIDVRPQEEYRMGHHPMARNLPYDMLDLWMRRLPGNRPLVLYCQYGSTSLMAARRLGRAGYEVYTVVGGFDAMKKVDRQL